MEMIPCRRLGTDRVYRFKNDISNAIKLLTINPTPEKRDKIFSNVGTYVYQKLKLPRINKPAPLVSNKRTKKSNF